MKILVCGSRNFIEYHFLQDVLDDLISDWYEEDWENRKGVYVTIIEGGAIGADFCARIYANHNGRDIITCKADWEKHGKAAGPIRNQQMLDDYKPDLVVAFDKDKGTADMIKRTKAAKIELIELRTDDFDE